MKKNLFEYLLLRMENKTNKFIKDKLTTNISVKFLDQNDISKIKPKKNIIYYSTSNCNWLNIFSGKLNLESISIGGEGKILKDNCFEYLSTQIFLNN